MHGHGGRESETDIDATRLFRVVAFSHIEVISSGVSLARVLQPRSRAFKKSEV